MREIAISIFLWTLVQDGCLDNVSFVKDVRVITRLAGCLIFCLFNVDVIFCDCFISSLKLLPSLQLSRLLCLDASCCGCFFLLLLYQLLATKIVIGCIATNIKVGIEDPPFLNRENNLKQKTCFSAEMKSSCEPTFPTDSKYPLHRFYNTNDSAISSFVLRCQLSKQTEVPIIQVL